MATHNVCSYNKYGFCKHGDLCRKHHEKRVCENQLYEVVLCSLRHPKICKFYREYKRCKFNPCAYKHEDDEKTIDILMKENKTMSEKIEQIVLDIKILTEKEKKSEDIIQKLNNFENIVREKNEKIEKLDDKIKDTNLKIFEQGKEIDMLKKKLHVLKEKEKRLTDLEVKFEELGKEVENMRVSQIVEKDSEIQENKCEKCGFLAKNEQVLKVHFKAKHTEPEKFKCFKCDFSAPTKSDLTDHNDEYWVSHRICLNPGRKKEYLEDFQQMKIDGFTVRESLYNEVLKWDD